MPTIVVTSEPRCTCRVSMQKDDITLHRDTPQRNEPSRWQKVDEKALDSRDKIEACPDSYHKEDDGAHHILARIDKTDSRSRNEPGSGLSMKVGAIVCDAEDCFLEVDSRNRDGFRGGRSCMPQLYKSRHRRKHRTRKMEKLYTMNTSGKLPTTYYEESVLPNGSQTVGRPLEGA